MAPSVSAAHLFLVACFAKNSHDPVERAAAQKRLRELGLTADEALAEAKRRKDLGVDPTLPVQ